MFQKSKFTNTLAIRGEKIAVQCAAIIAAPSKPKFDCKNTFAFTNKKTKK